MASQWPLVVGRLLALLPTLPGWAQVVLFDGQPVIADVPADYVTVGYVTSDVAGSFTKAQSPDGFRWLETGVVRSELTCVTGDVDIAGVRARAFALIDALEVSVRADQRLGVLSPEGTVDLSVDVDSLQGSAGSGQTIVFALHYFTVT